MTNGNDSAMPMVWENPEYSEKDHIVTKGLTKREWMATHIMAARIGAGYSNGAGVLAVQEANELIQALNVE